MDQTATITLLAFGSAAEVLGFDQRRIALPDPPTLAGLIATLEQQHPAVAEARGRLRYAINERYATADSPLSPGDEVAIIPPVAGGEGPAPAVARLVHDPIDTPSLIAEVGCPDSGAIDVFLGVVRAETSSSGQPLEALEYTAYEPMALAELQALADSAAERPGINAVRLVHRLGRLSIGETSVVAVVSTGHRAESFEVCRTMIEQLKQRVPIFKKELWAGGSHSWVEPAEGA